MTASNRGIDAAESAEPADLFEEPVIWVEGQKYTSVQYLGFNLFLGVAQHMLHFLVCFETFLRHAMPIFARFESCFFPV